MVGNNQQISVRKNPIGQLDGAILVLFFLYGLASQYTLLTLIAGVVFVVLLKSLWKPYTPPVFLYFIGLQWLQVFACILYADFLGEKMDVLFDSYDLTFLFTVTFLQLLAIIFVLRNYVRPQARRVVNRDVMREAVQQLNTKNVIIGYIVMAIVLPLVPVLTRGNASLYQLVVSFGILKYVFLALLVFILLLKTDTNKPLIVGILLFDFVLSFASFFSDFKTLLILIIIVYFTVNPNLSRRAIMRMVPIVVALLFFFSFWSYVKGGYRAYLNQGSGAQVQTVSNTEALVYMFNQVVNFDVSSVWDGAAILLSRVQYMERYSEVYKRVPSEINYKGGEELLSVFEFLLVPRFINPDKGVKDASLRTSYYTGKRFSSSSQGTSISMGYFCDFYIDFGLYFMFIPIIFLYMLIGNVYKRIINADKYNILLVYAIAIGFFLSLGAFESDSLFFLGKLRNNLAFMVIGYYTFFTPLQKFLLSKK
ncbi:MAG: hypothetical protein H6550_12345 [Chitinophagales bacterium]|nr:hypothetical protein [Chitinophagales bacterium]